MPSPHLLASSPPHPPELRWALLPPTPQSFPTRHPRLRAPAAGAPVTGILGAGELRELEKLLPKTQLLEEASGARCWGDHPQGEKEGVQGDSQSFCSRSSLLHPSHSPSSKPPLTPRGTSINAETLQWPVRPSLICPQPSQPIFSRTSPSAHCTCSRLLQPASAALSSAPASWQACSQTLSTRPPGHRIHTPDLRSPLHS